MNLPEKIALLKRGDEFVFGEVCKEFHQKIYYYVLSKTKSTYLAEEVTQLTLIKLWKNRTRLQENVSLPSQVIQIAKTTCIDLLRKEGNRARLLVMKGGVEPSTSIETLNGRELQSVLKQEVQKMPPIRKMVFELSRYEEKSNKEIADLLSVSTKTVENHITLALKQLRRVLVFLIFFYH